MPQRIAAAIASTTNTALSVYTRWMFASAQKLGAKARRPAPNNAAGRMSPAARATAYSPAHAAAAAAALNRLMRYAIEPTGTSSVHSFPARTYSG